MRDAILQPLFATAGSLKGVGPTSQRALERIAGPRIIDLLWHLPIGAVERPSIPDLAHAPIGQTATFRVFAVEHTPPKRPAQPYRIYCTDGAGSIVLVYFRAHAPYLQQLFPSGCERLISGRIESYGDLLQMVHPDYVVDPHAGGSIPALEPQYALGAGLNARTLGRIIAEALRRLPSLAEWLEAETVRHFGWPDWRSALERAHSPEVSDDLEPGGAVRRRLAFDELFANQIALLLLRSTAIAPGGRPLCADGQLAARALAAFGRALTASQTHAVADIVADMGRDVAMRRLLQGDVGSGKTIVAAVAMLTAVEAGVQACLMAPTEILARQHMAALAPLADAAGVPCGLLTGREKGRDRQALLDALAGGALPLVFGTHALFQEAVRFADLGLVVIDEQHRFGVDQRLALMAKGREPHLLVMSATPIPRTLILAAYGDMDASSLTEKPPGRQPVDTRVVPDQRLDEVVAAVGRSLAAGAKVFWVCPLVAEAEAADITAAEDRHRALVARFGNQVGLIHGRLSGEEKDRAIAAFTNGTVDILVATTIVEVGVDVPAASVMVIEHAERFGLAQLHQLRGRIGRGTTPSTCILVYTAPLSDTARQRLTVLRETDDGFRIAEEDLRLRGGGEVLGTRQSGLPRFRVADLAHHADLLPLARDAARKLLAADPRLMSERGRAVRVLLSLFERDAASDYLRSG